MNLAQFNDLCWREWAQARGDVRSLALTDDSYEELAGDTAGGMAGMVNPVTRTTVKVAAGASIDTAEVYRHYSRPVEAVEAAGQ